MRRTRRKKRESEEAASQHPSNMGCSSPQSANSSSRVLQRTVLAFFLLVLGAAGVQTLWAHLRILFYPYEANFGEGGLLYDAVVLARGGTIYAPVELGGWFSPYPPLYAWLVSFWPTPTFFFPRLISQVSHLACGIVLLVVLRKLGLNLVSAVCAALLYYANPFTRTFAAMGRVDMLGRFLEGLSVALGICVLNHRRSVWGAAIFSVLAMATKQTMFAGIVNLFGYWFGQDLARAKALLKIFLAGTIFCYIIIIISFGGNFVTNVFFDVRRSLSFQMWWPWIVGFLLCNTPVLCLAGYALLRRGCRPAFQFGVWATVAGVPSVLLAAQDGADVNYFFDVTWGLCALAAVGVHALTSSARALPQAFLFGVTLAAAGVDWSVPARYPTPQQVRQAQEVEQILVSLRKPVLSEFIGFGLKAGSDPAAIPYLDKKLEESGRRTPERVIGYLKEKRLGAVLVTSQARGRWPLSLLQALETYYEQQYVFPAMFAAEGEPDFAIFTPKPSK